MELSISSESDCLRILGNVFGLISARYAPHEARHGANFCYFSNSNSVLEE